MLSSKIVDLSEVEDELKNVLSEEEKLELQMIRLSDFQNNRDHVMTKEFYENLEKVKQEDCSNQDQYEEKVMAMLGEDFEEKLNQFEINRKVLATALKEENVEAINEAQNKPFYYNSSFVSLNDSIQKLIADITQGNENVNSIIDHSSRQEACSIM
jgi:UDP-2,3-diacylglucosamine pyrophosphatase LpxH